MVAKQNITLEKPNRMVKAGGTVRTRSSVTLNKADIKSPEEFSNATTGLVPRIDSLYQPINEM